MASQLVNFKSKQASPDVPDVEDIDPKELWDKRSEVMIIDVRRPDEWEGDLGHIPGAHHIVLDTLPDRFSEIPADKTVVFVCKSGGRSGRATAFAKEQGLEHVFNMKGGMMAWNQLNLEVEGRSN
jgi:hydroxyacylglutathione hydrolase